MYFIRNLDDIKTEECIIFRYLDDSRIYRNVLSSAILMIAEHTVHNPMS